MNTGTIKDESFFEQHQLIDHGEGLFDHLPGFLYFVKDTDLRFVSANYRLAKKLGVDSPKELLGKMDRDFFPPSQYTKYEKDDIEVIRSGTPLYNKVELVPRGKGFVDWSTTTKIPLFNATGEVIAIAGTTRPFSTGTSAIDIHSELGAPLKTMHSRFAENLPVSELAKQAHLSVSAFERKFKKQFHMTPRQYIRHLRVHDACYKLSHSNESLADIAASCGYVDQSHFSREFSRVTNETPLKYRKRHRAKISHNS
ncbi:AraC family transcriptional regulator [Rubritalea marina]|uniref:AraC family transcriptional regulator n=1 Tax=Rubritalea marina TaxID=361055 RepID=UPI000379D36A|nr:AraC family transcriptional regulator [Rubritalea marina]